MAISTSRDGDLQQGSGVNPVLFKPVHVDVHSFRKLSFSGV